MQKPNVFASQSNSDVKMKIFISLTISVTLLTLSSAIPTSAIATGLNITRVHNLSNTTLSRVTYKDYLGTHDKSASQNNISAAPKALPRFSRSAPSSRTKEKDPFERISQLPKQYIADQAKIVANFIRRLRKYVSGYCFLYERFELMAGKLHNELVDIDHLIRNSSCANKRLCGRLGFATYMFKNMQDAVVPFKLSQMIDTPGSQIVNRLVEFNIELLTYYTSQGEPDPRFEGYGMLVYSFIDLLKYWRVQFNLSPNEPINVQTMFDDQLEIAEKRVAEMKQFIGVD